MTIEKKSPTQKQVSEWLARNTDNMELSKVERARFLYRVVVAANSLS